MKFKFAQDDKFCEFDVNENQNLVSIRNDIIKLLWGDRSINPSTVKFSLKDRFLDINIPLLQLINSKESIINCQIDKNINHDLLRVLILNFENENSIQYPIEVRKDLSNQQLTLLIAEICQIDVRNISNQQNVIELADESASHILVDEKLREVFILPIEGKGPRQTISFSNMESVKNLKIQVAQKINFDQENFVLFHMFDYLEENKSIRQYKISNESTIKYCIYKKVNDLIELGEKISEGSFSIIYVATDKETNQTIAIKKYCATGMPINDDSFKPMIKELISFALLEDNERIVKLKTFFKDQELFYMGMEYMNGGSVHQFVVRLKPVIDKLIIKWSIQILEGIKYLHSNLIIHCDLKSSNILLDEDNNIKISGFSMSKLCQGATSRELSNGFTNSKPPTYNFLAPEAFDENKKLGSKADIWSFGAILVELVTGNEPFYNMDLPDIAMWFSTNQKICYKFPQERLYDFKHVIDNCLMTDPQMRPSAVDLLNFKVFQ